MADIAALLEEATDVQSRLIAALQAEYYCDDVTPPPAAFGWPEGRLRSFFESGGEDVIESAPPAASLQLPPAPALLRPGRPIILCLGDATTEFAQHVINQPTADVGSSKHKASLSVVVDPVASEFLRETATDNPRVEHGPGWATLLARDYAWRTTADVVVRGYSGYTSKMLLADLPELFGSLNAADVIAVVLLIGANDAVAEGEPTHVPLTSYKANLASIAQGVASGLPNAKLLMLGVPPLDEVTWQASVAKATDGRKSGKERSAARHVEYNDAAKAVAAKVGAPFIDLVYAIKYKFANAMMELQNPHRDGLHFTKPVNIFVYRSVKSALDDLGLSASKLPPHRPAALAAAYPKEVAGDEDGRLRRRAWK